MHFINKIYVIYDVYTTLIYISINLLYNVGIQCKEKHVISCHLENNNKFKKQQLQAKNLN